MNGESSFRTQVALSLISRLNNRLYWPLLEKCGGIEGFFLETEIALAAIYHDFHLPPDAFNRKEALQNATAEIEKIDQLSIQVCSVEHGHYPELLSQCEDAPLVFFYKGKLFPSSSPDKFLAVVGTRHASMPYQKRVEAVLEELSQMGHHPVIVSGLAFGIDASAHRASLKYGLKTYAVLGHGLHTIYPATHRGLAQKILDSGGALISEYPCTMTTHPYHFLQRNRIIAGLCHATLVAESAQKGGAMATARLALAYNRDVMAFPGRPEDFYSAGCNYLIKENIAALVENGKDVAHLLNYPVSSSQTTLSSSSLPQKEGEESLLLNLLKEKKQLHIDELKRILPLTPGKLAALLLQLEMEGKIMGLPGFYYVLR